MAEEIADIVTMDTEDKVSENKGGDVIGEEGMKNKGWKILR